MPPPQLSSPPSPALLVLLLPPLPEALRLRVDDGLRALLRVLRLRRRRRLWRLCCSALALLLTLREREREGERELVLAPSASATGSGWAAMCGTNGSAPGYATGGYNGCSGSACGCGGASGTPYGPIYIGGTMPYSGIAVGGPKYGGGGGTP
jgi:hypothetical protein